MDSVLRSKKRNFEWSCVHSHIQNEKRDVFGEISDYKYFVLRRSSLRSQNMSKQEDNAVDIYELESTLM